MRTLPILLIALVPLACGQAARTDAPKTAPPPVPEAFQDHSSISDVKSRSTSGDVVERLFAEELERDTALAALFDRWQQAQAIFNDSARGYLDLQANDQAFYASADAHKDQLMDSLDRQHMAQRLKASGDHAAQRFGPMDRMQEERIALEKEFRELRVLVMLDRTVQRMEAYQHTPVPGSGGMQTALQRLRQLRAELRKHVS